MRPTTQQPSDGESRVSLYEEVTDRILRELETGIVPWVQPWETSSASLGLPCSAATRRHYSGINILILWDAVIRQGFASQEWLTFRQALSLGGHVRKGERGTIICYADTFIPKDERERARIEGDDPSVVPFLKRFTVFNVDQCEGLPAQIVPPPRILSEVEPSPDADALIAATGARIVEGASAAFYHQGEDLIRIPSRDAFASTADFYCTAFHELGHYADIRIMPRRCAFPRARVQSRRGMSA